MWRGQSLIPAADMAHRSWESFLNLVCIALPGFSAVHTSACCRSTVVILPPSQIKPPVRSWRSYLRGCWTPLPTLLPPVNWSGYCRPQGLSIPQLLLSLLPSLGLNSGQDRGGANQWGLWDFPPFPDSVKDWAIHSPVLTRTGKKYTFPLWLHSS